MTELTVLSLPVDPEALAALAPRERIVALEAAIRAQPAEGLIHELPVNHYIANGVYVRELLIPKGTVGTGRIHNHDHIVILIGDISVYDGLGGGQRFTGVNVFTSTRGVKRAAYAHADTRFITAHRMSNPAETDIAALEREFVTETYEDFDKFMNTQPQGMLP